MKESVPDVVLVLREILDDIKSAKNSPEWFEYAQNQGFSGNSTSGFSGLLH